MRNDEEFAYVSCWEYKGEDTPVMYKEPLDYEFIVRQQRNYKSQSVDNKVVKIKKD